MSRTLRLRWAQKLARAKFFVVLTDKDSVIALEGVNPHSFKDLMALQAQSVAIEDFLGKLKALKVDHDKAMDKFQEGKTTPRRKKVTKIKVKEG